MIQRATFGALVLLVLLLGGVALRADDEPSPDPRQVVEGLIPKDWMARERSVPGLDHLLRGAHSFFAHQRAKGGYPYELILIGSDGAVLARSDGTALYLRARARAIAARRASEGWVVEEGPPEGLVSVLDALEARAIGAHPGNALTASIALVHLLTFEGVFATGRVTALESGGYDVEIDWRQGRVTWSFEERATWSLRFDRAGRLVELRKKQTSYKAHGRK